MLLFIIIFILLIIILLGLPAQDYRQTTQVDLSIILGFQSQQIFSFGRLYSFLSKSW